MDDDAIEAAEALAGSTGAAALLDGLDAIIKEPDEEQAEAVLDALLRMSSDIKSPEVLTTLASRLTTLGGCLSTFMDAAVVVEVLFAVLNKLDLKGFGTRDNAENVLKAMDSHSDGEETLVEYGCLVIAKLAATSEEGKGHLIELDAGGMLDRAEGIITNERNKKYVTEARKVLST
mmetsp:Transcript_3670/g.6969  ORF Transcript_3670/g.6969 Transcript_3670/m.6969 type:complete len:176 (+) Transcript_3670:19-546(+)|eukprot:CAMPEP_0182455120 /NCGR_PEP_ID=MMETSP1319-20130603/1434_1 /TAXON_ID=172717 /ORGANISM="Bolidomonas pacifica, Strain RCC208" /LENGTH=175 /DNA_ID=CAMNT_0024653155 /DNA_START=21 /DNA_END=548 /DNA_ORIENTATION=-